MSKFTALSTTALLCGAATALSACITVAPDTTAGKVATRTSGIAKAIKPTRKPTMTLPASHTVSQTDLALACQGGQSGTKRIMIIDENGQQIIKDTSVNCSQYIPETPEPRLIRIAVDGAQEQVFQINDQGQAVPLGYDASTSRVVTSQAPTPVTRTVVVQPASVSIPAAAQSYQSRTYAPAVSNNQFPATNSQYTVRSGDNLYAISRKHCVSLESLTALNGIYRPYTINPGQVLSLPQGGC